jgi:hypothetical protein
VLVAIAYRQVVVGGIEGIRPAASVSKLWQPFVVWADGLAGRIRNRIQRNAAHYDEQVLDLLAGSQQKLDTLVNLLKLRSGSPQDVQTNLDKIQQQYAAMGAEAVLQKQAEDVYRSVRLLPNLDYEEFMYRHGITSWFQYHWYAREWRSKLLSAAIMGVLVAAGFYGVVRLGTPQHIAAYYMWRLEKPNATAYDRYRAGERLLAYLGDRETSAEICTGLTRILRFDALPLDTADRILAILIASRDRTSRNGVDLPALLLDSLRTGNPDIRLRIQGTVLYVARERGREPDSALKDWQPAKQDSPALIDEKIRVWRLFLQQKP